RRGVARPDHRYHRPRQRGGIATHGKQRRRVVDFGEPRRIGGLVQRDKLHPERAGGGKLALGLGTRTDSHVAAAAAREIGQLRERRGGAAAVAKEAAETARPDVLAADEPQPVNALVISERGAVDGCGPGFGHRSGPSRDYTTIMTSGNLAMRGRYG